MAPEEINSSSDKADNEVEEKMITPVDCCTSKNACKNFCCSFNNYWKFLGGVAIVGAYLLLGGLCFNALEGPTEQAELAKIKTEQIEAAAALAQEVNTFTQFIVNSTNLSEAEALNLTNTLVAVAKRFADAGVNESLPDPVWDFASAVFFASTVLTTIGYGTIFPVTDGGKILFIFYAVVGIPLTLILLSTIGSILSAWLDAALAPLSRKKGPLVVKVVSATISLLTTLIFFILIPAALYVVVEGSDEWSYLNSVYYCFVTLTTVGFGDFVPGTNGSRISNNTALIGLYRIITAVWVWIGLALISTVISEVQGLFEGLSKAINKCNVRRRKNTYRRFSVNGGTNEILNSYPPKSQENSTAPPQSRENGTAPPQSRENGTAPPQSRENSTAPPQSPENITAPPQSRENGTAPPQSRENCTAPPQSRENGTAPPQSRENGTAPPQSRENGTAPPQSRENCTAPPQSRENGTAPPQSRENCTAPPQSRENGTAPPQSRENITAPPQSRENGTAPPKSRENITAPPQSRENGTAPPQSRENGTAPPQSRENSTAVDPPQDP